MLKRYLAMDQAGDAGSGGAGGTTSTPPASGGQPPATTTGAATPPAPPANAGAPGTTAGSTKNLPSWAQSPDAGLEAEDIDLVALKQYAKPGEVVKALRHAQKFIGAPPDELIRIPKTGPDEAALNEIAARLGVPQDPAGYQLKPGEGDDPATLEWFAKTAHKLKMTPNQVKGLLAEHNTLVTGAIKAQQDESAAHLAMEANALKLEWGAQYDHRKAVAENVVAVLGVSKDQLQAIQEGIGPAGLVKMFYGLAAKIGEDKFVTSNTPPSSGLTPEAARARIAELKEDREFRKNFPDKLTAQQRREWDEAHKYAYGE